VEFHFQVLFLGYMHVGWQSNGDALFSVSSTLELEDANVRFEGDPTMKVLLSALLSL
jgi:hypothetical protein